MNRWRSHPLARAFRMVVLETLLPAWLIVTFVVLPVQVQGDSMLPTLEAGDVLVVWKLDRWLHTWGLWPESLEHGDLIVLKPNDWRNWAPMPLLGAFGLEYQPYFVKRVIGLAGDHVSIRDGQVLLGSSTIVEPYIKQPAAVQSEPELEVLQNQVYVLGDNRLLGESIDSRRFGPQNRSTVAGRAVLRIWPFEKFGWMPRAQPSMGRATGR